MTYFNSSGHVELTWHYAKVKRTDNPFPVSLLIVLLINGWFYYRIIISIACNHLLL